jgi:uncharacterized membrane protein
MAFCPSCGAQMSDGTAFCPACGKPAGGTVASNAPIAAGGVPDNVAGALAYFTIVAAIIFLVLEPFSRSRFVRFHSFQCIFFALAWFVLSIGLNIVAHIPIFGFLTLLIWPLVGLAGLIIWLLLVLKAFQGQKFKLPIIGDLAEKQAGA